MRAHIDWLTFTMAMRYGDRKGGTSDFAEEYAEVMEATFLHAFGHELLAKAFGGKWEKNERSRAPYVDSWKLAEAEITLFASPSLTHCCCEISGKGCERLIQEGLLDLVLAAIHERVTRIDIACDVETDCRPKEFVSQTDHARMRASGYQISETGETCYVGSQKSDRYARVYRYNPPHPRAHLLRIEHVFRRDYAKMVSKQLVASGMDAIANASRDAFGWTHSVWNTGSTDSVDLSLVSPQREAGKTVYWLVTSCASAFRKLVENGDIKDPEAFLKRHFLMLD